MNNKKMRTGKCDIFNNSNKINLRLEMPGVSKENLELFTEVLITLLIKIIIYYTK